MELQRLYKMQTALDRHIEEKHNLTQENLFDRKILALLVELGELANETRCFKFWSVKPASERKVILEEFVDSIHFLLSLGIERGYTYDDSVPAVKNERTVSEQFLRIYGAIDKFRISKTEQDYYDMFSEYLILAKMLGFTECEIEQAYLEKNEVNYQRQEKGY